MEEVDGKLGSWPQFSQTTKDREGCDSATDIRRDVAKTILRGNAQEKLHRQNGLGWALWASPELRREIMEL